MKWRSDYIKTRIPCIYRFGLHNFVVNVFECLKLNVLMVIVQ